MKVFFRFAASACLLATGAAAFGDGPNDAAGRENIALGKKAMVNTGKFQYSYAERFPVQADVDAARAMGRALTDGHIGAELAVDLRAADPWVAVELDGFFDLLEVRLFAGGWKETAIYPVSVLTTSGEWKKAGAVSVPAEAPNGWFSILFAAPVTGTGVLVGSERGPGGQPILRLDEIEVHGQPNREASMEYPRLATDVVARGVETIRVEAESPALMPVIPFGEIMLNDRARTVRPSAIDMPPRDFPAQQGASGGRGLCNFSVMSGPDMFAEYVFETEQEGDFHLLIRYVQPRMIGQNDGSRIGILMNGKAPPGFEAVQLPNTGGESPYISQGDYARWGLIQPVEGATIRLAAGRHTLRIVPLDYNRELKLDYFEFTTRDPGPNPLWLDPYVIPPACVFKKRDYLPDGRIVMEYELINRTGRTVGFHAQPLNTTFRPPWLEVAIPEPKMVFAPGARKSMTVTFDPQGGIEPGDTVGATVQLRYYHPDVADPWISRYADSAKPLLIETRVTPLDLRKMKNPTAPPETDKAADQRRLAPAYAAYLDLLPEAVEKWMPSHVGFSARPLPTCSSGHPGVLYLPRDFTDGDGLEFECPLCGDRRSGLVWGVYWRWIRMHIAAEAADRLSEQYRATGDLAHARAALNIIRAWYRKYPLMDRLGAWDQVTRADRAAGVDVTHFNTDVDSMIRAFFNLLDSGLLTPDDYDRLEHNHIRPGLQYIRNWNAHTATFGINFWKEGQGDVFRTSAYCGLFLDDPAPLNLAQAYVDAAMRHMGNDGWNKEGSTGYHLKTVMVLQELAGLMTRAGRKDYFAEPSFRNMFRVFYQFVYPDGSIPHPHDNSAGGKWNNRWGWAAKPLDMAVRLWPDDDEFRQAREQCLGDGRIMFPGQSRHFPDRGFALLHNADTDNPTAVFLDYGDNSANHAHADMLNLTLFTCGIEALFDAGTSGYGSPWHQAYSVQTPAHNTLLVNKQGQTRARRNAECLAFSDSPGARLIVAAEKAPWQAHPTVLMSRALLLTDRWVVDFFGVRSTDGEAREYSWLAHVKGSIDGAPNGEAVGREPDGMWFFKDLKKAVAPDGVSVRWTLPTSGTLAMQTPGAQGLECLTGAAPFWREDDYSASILVLRRTAPHTVFPAVWHGSTGAVSVKSVESATYTLDGTAPLEGMGAFMTITGTDGTMATAGYCPDAGTKKSGSLETDAVFVYHEKRGDGSQILTFGGGTYATVPDKTARGKGTATVEW